MLSILANLTPSCFKPGGQVKLLEDGSSMSCTFCGASREKGFNVVFEDETFIAFLDRKPAAQHHIQVIPKRHIRSVRTLVESDAGLVRSMEAIGHKLLEERAVSPSLRKMGFHIPPFNSVNHLHLHVQALPYLSRDREAKYPIAKGDQTHQKGFSWFSEVGQTIRILENGGHVGVFPC